MLLLQLSGLTEDDDATPHELQASLPNRSARMPVTLKKTQLCPAHFVSSRAPVIHKNPALTHATRQFLDDGLPMSEWLDNSNPEPVYNIWVANSGKMPLDEEGEHDCSSLPPKGDITSSATWASVCWSRQEVAF